MDHSTTFRAGASALLVTTLFLLGCGGPEAQLIGRWTTKPLAAKAAETPPPGDNPFAAALGALVQGAVASVELDLILRKDGTAEQTNKALGFTQGRKLYWKAEDRDGQIVLRMSESEDFAQFQEWRIDFPDDSKDRFRAGAGELGQLEFVRVEE